jgi:hypothetical protein
MSKLGYFHIDSKVRRLIRNQEQWSFSYLKTEASLSIWEAECNHTSLISQAGLPEKSHIQDYDSAECKTLKYWVMWTGHK